MTSPNKPAIPPPFLPAKSTTSSWTGLGRRQQQQQQWTLPIANAVVNNHTEEEDKDDLYEEPPDNDLEDKGGEGEEEEEEGEDGLEGEGVGEDGAATRATGGQWYAFSLVFFLVFFFFVWVFFFSGEVVFSVQPGGFSFVAFNQGWAHICVSVCRPIPARSWVWVQPIHFESLPCGRQDWIVLIGCTAGRLALYCVALHFHKPNDIVC
jgi:hypothetical protein